MERPEYAKVGEKLYKINTDFKIAIKCDEIVKSDVRDEEKTLAVVYLLYGDEGLNNPQDYEELVKKAVLFLQCGKEGSNTDNKEPSMDYEQDKAYIRASFYTDYQISDIYATNMHWWDFNDLMNGLTENCVLNRIRYIREYDTSDIKDSKLLAQWKKQKEEVALKKKEPHLTEEQERSMNKFYEQINLKGKED